MKRVTLNMHTPHSGSSLPDPHSFYVPVRITPLDKAAPNREGTGQSFSSLLVIITGGSGRIEIDRELIRVSSGTIICSDSSVHIDRAISHRLQGIWIEYIVVSGKDRHPSPLSSSIPLRKCKPMACTMAARLLSSWNYPEENQPFALQQLFTELLAELYNNTDNTEPSSHWLEHVLQYIEAHYNEELTRGLAAELAGVTPEHFSRVFRKATGQTFNEYVTLLRIRKAQQRILTGAPTLSTLALEVGYGEGTYLSRKFKQVVGISPAAYHRKNKSVVSLNFNHTASLQALEVIPRLGVYSAWMERMQPVPHRHKLEVEGSYSTGLYERLSSAKPDVIISYTLSGNSKQLLSVAPVIELPFMQMNWREQFRLIAEVTGRRTQAEEWLNVYDEHCHLANLQLDRQIGPRGTAVVWELGRDAAYCFSSSYGHGSQILYDDLGFRPPDNLVTAGLIDKGYLEIAFHDVAAYPADHIFITCSASAAEVPEPLHSLLHPAAQPVLAASSGRQIYFLNQPAMFYGFDPLSSEAQLKVLLQALIS